MEIFIAIEPFGAGGDVLYLIAAATFCMWALIFERLWFIRTEHKEDVREAVTYWKKRGEIAPECADDATEDYLRGQLEAHSEHVFH